MPTAIAGVFVLLFVAVIGFATQRGSICSVLAARQWVETGGTSRMRSFLLAALWSMATVTPIAWATGWLAPAPIFGLDKFAVAGAVAYGIGTMLNGACVFGTASRIFSGDLILRRIVDFDIGVNAVILNAPSSAGIPPRKLGLRTAAVIDEVFIAADSDHAAPGALADQRA